MATLTVASLLGFAGFGYILLRLDGTRRFALALVPPVLAGIVSDFALVKIREILGRPRRRILGTPSQELAVFTILSLVLTAFLLWVGLFWIPE